MHLISLDLNEKPYRFNNKKQNLVNIKFWLLSPYVMSVKEIGDIRNIPYIVEKMWKIFSLMEIYLFLL